MSIEYEHTFAEEEKLKLDKYKQYYIKHINSKNNPSQFDEGQVIYTYNNYTGEKLEEVFRSFQLRHIINLKLYFTQKKIEMDMLNLWTSWMTLLTIGY